MRLLGCLLIILTSLQSTPYFVSSIVIYAAIYLIVLFYALFINRNGVYKKKFKLNKYVFFYLIWLVFGLFSIFWSVEKYLWFRSCIILLINCSSVFIFLQFINDEDDVKYYLKIVFYTFLVNNLIGWFEVITKKYLFTITEYIGMYTVNRWPVASFLNTNDFCTYLSISFPFVLAYFMYKNNIWYKSIIILTLFSSLLLMFRAGSRANILAVVLGLAFLWLLSNLDGRLEKLVILVFSVFFLLLIIIGISSSSLGDKILNKFIGNDKSSDQLRMNLIRNGMIYLKNSNYLGVGAGNLEYWLPNFQYYKTFNFLYIHNWWVETLVNYGVVIFGGYLYSWINLLLTSTTKKSRNKKVSQILGMGILVFALASTSPSSILLMKWLPIYTGLTISCITFLEKRGNIEKVNG